MTDSQLLRERMVERQIAARGVRDPYTLDAMKEATLAVYAELADHTDAR